MVRLKFVLFKALGFLFLVTTYESDPHSGTVIKWLIETYFYSKSSFFLIIETLETKAFLALYFLWELALDFLLVLLYFRLFRIFYLSFFLVILKLEFCFSNFWDLKGFSTYNNYLWLINLAVRVRFKVFLNLRFL